MTSPPANTPLPRTVARSFDADAATELLLGMVRIPSLSGQESQVARYLVERMAALGLESFVDDAGNAVGIRHARRTPARDIVLLGHIDTVPGVVPVRIEGDLLYGRGSVDAKGPLATFIVAAAHAQVPDDIRLIVIGAVEEECATSAGARFAASRYAPAACIIGEPSHADGYTLGYKGRLVVDLDIRAASAHSAGPEPTAAELGAAWWRDLLARFEALNAGKKGVFEQIQPRLRTFRTEHDGLHDVARLQLGIRLPPGFGPDACAEFVNQACAAVLAYTEHETRFTGAEHAYVADRSSPLARAVSSAIRDQGATPHPRVKTGTADMNVVGPVWNCPILAYGPGDSALDHTPNEQVSLREYHAAIRTLVRALEILEL
jgi:LysW-gamma-L-lysine carboxypeptidase